MKLILRFLKPHWKLCTLTVFLILVDVVGALIIPTFAAELMKQADDGVEFNSLIFTAVLMGVAALIAGGAAIGSVFACSDLTARVGADMRDALYKKSLELAVSDFKKFGTASVTTRTVSDITNIQTALINTIMLVLPVPLVFILSITMAFILDWVMGLILLAILIVIMIIAVFIIKSSSPLFRKLQKLLDKMSSVLLENITGVRVVRAFNNEEREEERMDDAFSGYAVTSIKANRRFALLDGISFFAINILIILVYCLSGFRISSGRFHVADITAIIEYAMFALFYLMMAQMVILTLPRAMECSERVRSVLDFSPTIADNVTGPVQLDGDSEDVLKFERVAFRFADADEYTLRRLNFSCKRGQTTAIIGGTGSGKSTVASLMLRFNDVTEGRVLLNGVDIRKMPQRQLRDNIAYVQQRAWLFSGTIAENLRFGKENATDEELMHAIDVAQAGEFVRALPEGLNSFVAQGGTNFSGGQKQRLSIARALVKKPELYIFDDSFSALDFKTDAALRHALAAETKDAAVVIIAQRVSTIRHAEQIIVLNEGEPVGIGTHEELMENCSVYREIYKSQTKEEDEQ